jgi:tRNA A-37 threonylcarbamoyl transferase component Bud32
MHEAGIRHGDLKFSNLAATRDASGGIAFAAFMDLDSMKRVKRPLDKTERGVELARLAASTVAIVADSGETLDRAALCARFAKLYADAGGGTLDPETLSAEIGIWLA